MSQSARSVAIKPTIWAAYCVDAMNFKGDSISDALFSSPRLMMCPRIWDVRTRGGPKRNCVMAKISPVQSWHPPKGIRQSAHLYNAIITILVSTADQHYFKLDAEFILNCWRFFGLYRATFSPRSHAICCCVRIPCSCVILRIGVILAWHICR